MQPLYVVNWKPQVHRHIPQHLALDDECLREKNWGGCSSDQNVYGDYLREEND